MSTTTTTTPPVDPAATATEANAPSSTGEDRVVAAPGATSQHHPHPHQPQIRHAGRAHIRGKIRRVWRPRYLELWDNALVRYYELPASADIALQADSDWDHVNMIPKYTLAVYHARILDGTTRRDMHVGLPHGAFGFLFRGQRLTHLEEEPPPPALASTSITAASVLNPLNVQGSCQGPPPIKEPRDFLCAVSSLEEAQMWVVALQWAASYHQQHHHQSLPSEPWWKQEGEFTDYDSNADDELDNEDGNENDDEDHDPDLVLVRKSGKPRPIVLPTSWDDAETSLLETPPTTSAVNKLPVQEPTTTTTSSVKDPSSPVGPHRSATATTATKGAFGGGKVVVSKVVTYRVVRLPGGPIFRFEVAYEIHGMLLRRRVSERWNMLRTADDLQSLVTDLCQELGPGALDRAAQLGPLRRLPRLKDKPQPDAVAQSLSIVDSILRSLVLDATMVNTIAMKTFLGLPSLKHQQQSSGTGTRMMMHWWHAHDPQAVFDRTTETLPEHITTDHYVKTWVQEGRFARNPSSSASSSLTLDSCAVLFWQRPLVYLGAVGLSAAALLPLARLWKQVVPSTTVRMDALVVSWVTAAYFGRRYEQENKLAAATTAASSRRSRRPTSEQQGGVIPGSKKPASSAPVSVAKAAKHKREGAGEDSAYESVQGEEEEDDDLVSAGSFIEDESDGEGEMVSDFLDEQEEAKALSSPLPEFPANSGGSCWSRPGDSIFHVRGGNYLQDRIKIPSEAAPLTCRGVDVWITGDPQRHIARHPAVLGGTLADEDTFLVNFLLPFGNFVAYFSIPPLHKFPKKLRNVWTKFLKGDQQYRDARLKLLPVVVDGPWIVKTAVGAGKSPALLGKVIPLQYFFRDPDRHRRGVYEVDVIITASTIAKGILSVVKGHTNTVSIAFAFIIEAAEQDELPETVLCSFQVHKLHLEDCPILPELNLDETDSSAT